MKIFIYIFTTADRTGGPLCLVSSTAECGTELLKVQYAKVSMPDINMNINNHNESFLPHISSSKLSTKCWCSAAFSMLL